MSSNKGSSEVRKLRRGNLKLVYFKSLSQFFKYRLTSRGRWVQIGNDSAPSLTTHQINKLQLNNNIKV